MELLCLKNLSIIKYLCNMSRISTMLYNLLWCNDLSHTYALSQTTLRFVLIALDRDKTGYANIVMKAHILEQWVWIRKSQSRHWSRKHNENWHSIDSIKSSMNWMLQLSWQQIQLEINQWFQVENGVVSGQWALGSFTWPTVNVTENKIDI